MPLREISAEGGVPERVGVAVSTFNAAITENLASAAIGVFEAAGIEDIVVARVPGALELGVTALALIDAGCAAVVCVGAVIKGETDHYEYVSMEAARAITEVALRTGRPVANAVLTVREYDHAVERSRPGSGNKGSEAAGALLETLKVLSGIKSL